MRMEDPVPTYTYLIDQLKAKHSDLAYLHVVESRVAGAAEDVDADVGGTTQPGEAASDHVGRPITNSNEFLRKSWLPRPYISAGGYSEATGADLAIRASEYDVLVAFGRSFLATPDLPVRLQKGLPLNQPDYATLYAKESAKGYTDYPFAEETKA